jgi:hypothetical protein
MKKEINFNEIFANWPSPFVARQQLPKLTGGILNAKTLANLDSIGKGIKGKILIENKRRNFFIVHKIIVYPVKNVIEFLEKKLNEPKLKVCVKK